MKKSILIKILDAVRSNPELSLSIGMLAALLWFVCAADPLAAFKLRMTVSFLELLSKMKIVI